MAATIEIDHFIGYNDIKNGSSFHPNGQDYFFCISIPYKNI